MTHPLLDPDMPGVDPASMAVFKSYKRSMMLHRRLMMASFAEDLHPAQAGCLQVLASRDGIGQSELAEMLHVARPTVTTMLQRMEAAGTIERRPDESDSRITRVYLTDEGRHLAESMRTGFAEMVGSSVGRMSPEKRDQLKSLLDELNGIVEAALKERGITTWTHPHGHGGTEHS